MTRSYVNPCLDIENLLHPNFADLENLNVVDHSEIRIEDFLVANQIIGLCKDIAKAKKRIFLSFGNLWTNKSNNAK